MRIALNLKGQGFDPVPHHLRHGEQRAPAYLQLNPQGFVPCLETGHAVLVQSLAIIEYLDEAFPDPALLPASALDRAHVRSLAQIVACDIHPINNLRVLNYLRGNFGAGDAAIGAWYNHWIDEGFAALEKILAKDPRTGAFCFGDTPGLADIFLVPQVVNAANYRLDLTPYPTITRIFDACMSLAAFAAAQPKVQADAE